MSVNALWEKELTLKDAVYVDIFKNVRGCSFYREATIEVGQRPSKDDQLSLQYRQEGNAEFIKNNLKKALELFNKSLCFAEVGSEHMSLAYANRATCFLNLKMYEQSLSDIELATEASYPLHLMYKLDKRKADCLKHLKSAAKRKQPIQPKLSFEANEKIPYLANVLKVERNDEFGRHIIAECDIDEDKTVLIEEPMFKLLTNSEYKKCMNCLTENLSMVACSQCTSAMFCSECYGNEFHKFECSMKNIKCFETVNGVLTRSTVRFTMWAVLNGLNIFPSSSELIRFVEASRLEFNSNAIPVSDGSPKSNFKTFLALHHLQTNEEVFAVNTLIACIVYDTLMGYQQVTDNFQSTADQRFLMHLVTHFTIMFKSNNVLLREWSDDLATVIKNDGLETFGTGLFNIGCYFNHACMPNVMRMARNNFAIIKTVKPIKKGEQVCLRYCISPQKSTTERREVLQKLCGFLCNCELCLSNGPSIIESPAIQSEYKLLALQMASLTFSEKINAKALEKKKEKCFKFLAKYRQMPISEGIIFAYEHLRMIFEREIREMVK